MTKQILKTQNTKWGFWGTTNMNYSDEETKKRWNNVFGILLDLSGLEPEKIREFLDDRMGRYLADACDQEKNVKQKVKELYFQWIDKTLFEDKKNTIKIEKDRTLFGTLVLNEITHTEDIILYTYKHPNRIYNDYAKCINKNEGIYDIQMDWISPIE